MYAGRMTLTTKVPMPRCSVWGSRLSPLSSSFIMLPSSLSRLHSQVFYCPSLYVLIYTLWWWWLGLVVQLISVQIFVYCIAYYKLNKLLAEESDKGQARKSNAPKHKVAPPAIPLQGDKKDDVRTASPGIIDDKSTETTRYCNWKLLGFVSYKNAFYCISNNLIN